MVKPKSDVLKRKGPPKGPSPGGESRMASSMKKVGKQPAPHWMALTPTGSRTSNTREQPSTENKKASGSNRNKDVSTKKKKAPKIAPKYAFAISEMIEGVNQYKVAAHIRKSPKALEVDVYTVHDVEGNEEYRMKTCNQDFQVLKTEAALLRKLEKKPGDKCFLSMAEYGTVSNHNLEFLIVSPFGATLYEIQKKVLGGANLSMDCAVSVGLQMLKAIKDLHSIGYIHRNIRPAAFTCGLGNDEMTIYLQDFRHVRKFETQSKHVAPRTSVKIYASLRYCSRACQTQKDQGRKDDIESFIYTLFHLVDSNSLSWKKETTPEGVLSEKVTFMLSNCKDQYAKMSHTKWSPIISAIFGLDFAGVPDYDGIKTMLTEFQTSEKLDAKACDWKGKTGLNEIEGDTNRSVDCRVTGERDVQVKAPGGNAKKKKANRKKLNPGDLIMGVGATTGWKVINLLGSGGFGDVYKVHRDNQPPSQCYALKTESEEGEKRYLRLKVEVTVMMKTAEQRKDRKFEHFVEFVDRGKCEDLKCKFVVMGLVGPSLEDIRRKYLLAAFSKHTSFNVAIQTVNAIKDLHSLGYLHRDIKPANYAVGLAEGESTVYMLDFGIAKLYLDEQGNHKVKRKKVKFLGTLRYACRACMMQQEQGRKDDLETWIYLVFDIMDESNGMPWRKMGDAKEILKSKKEFFNSFSSLPFSSTLKRLKDLVMYIDKMQYETTPDYEYILNFLKTSANDVNAKITKKLDWVGRLIKKEFDSDSEKSDKNQSGDDDE